MFQFNENENIKEVSRDNLPRHVEMDERLVSFHKRFCNGSAPFPSTVLGRQGSGCTADAARVLKEQEEGETGGRHTRHLADSRIQEDPESYSQTAAHVSH